MGKSLIILNGVKISTDKQGRYRLNDLHKASGGEAKHQPGLWNVNQQTQGLVDLLKKETLGNPIVSIEGRNGGTYACKELVYAYAMWISPEFHLHVIRKFDAVIMSEYKAKQDRDTARLEYKPMTDAVKKSREEQGKTIAPHHFSNEADLINRIALGMTAAKFRVHHDIDRKEPIRDYLTPEQMRCITELQRANTVFISMGWDYEQRKHTLTGIYEKNHKKPLLEELHRLAA
ncbi:KilA-N domain-containing protein [Xenorhabdus kozodoii]|uniref:AntA/AntB antirepressor family protein n=1 Tax=Xenorhabdus kozodoii TaxID=351676 RepID=A0A2D0L004_9GAMM|nr:KilA-N domain-containing protein [Xenorhabdus kozodoii]PHM69013.1 antA/AntB antirepressor family protein [Xenorhabdus kozodoii]